MLIDCSAHPSFDGHDEVHRFEDRSVGLLAFVAIHRKGALGVAGGGCRMWPYASEEAALRDVLRLSTDMTYKFALAGLGAGGAKCVVVGDPNTDKNAALLKKVGEAIHSLRGRFVAGGDVGIHSEDLKVIAQETPYVELGSHGRDTVSEATAAGVYWAIIAALGQGPSGQALHDKRIAVQGLGKVGGRVAELLARDGASLLVADVDRGKAERMGEQLGARVVSPTDVLECEVDVFSPCALGDVLTEENAQNLRCRIIAGSANNQLESRRVLAVFGEKNITYVPDFVANLGGTLAGARPSACQDAATILALTREVYDITRRVLERAERGAITTNQAAEELVRTKMQRTFGRGQVFVSWFHVLWRVPSFARTALRLRTWSEELRGRWLRRSPEAYLSERNV